MNLPMKRRATTPPHTAATLASAIWAFVSLRSFLIDVMSAAGAKDDQKVTIKESQARWNATVWGVARPQKARLMDSALPSES